MNVGVRQQDKQHFLVSEMRKNCCGGSENFEATDAYVKFHFQLGNRPRLESEGESRRSGRIHRHRN